MTTVRDELAKALRSSLPRWNLEDDRQCREAIARHEREPEDQDAAVVQARANAFEEAARIAEAMVSPPLGKLDQRNGAGILGGRHICCCSQQIRKGLNSGGNLTSHGYQFG